MLGLPIPWPPDPRLLVRALDDLHAIADAARALPAIEARLTERIVAVEERLDDVLGAAGTLSALDTRAGGVLEGLDRVLAAVDRVGDVEREVAELVGLARDLRDGLPTLDEALESIRQLNAAAGTLAAAVQPLQGTAERLGRIADRLPGGRAR